MRNSTAAAPAAKEKTNWLTGAFYGMGEVGCQMSWYMISTYLTVFYTDIVGLSAAAISMIFIIARVWDAVNDPMMGVIADKTKSRWGKFRPYLLFAPIFLSIFNLLTFSTFNVSGTMKVVLALLTYIGAGMAYTAVCIPYQGLVNLIAKDSQVRMNYASCRAIGSGAIGIVLSAVSMPLILFFGKSETPNAHGYFMTALIASIALLPCFWACFAGCKERPDEVAMTEAKRTPLKEALPAVFKNKNIVITILSTFSGAIGAMARMSMLTFYILYVVGNPMMIAPIFTTMTVCQLIGNASLPWGTKTFTKKGYMLITTFIQIAALVAIFFFGTDIRLLFVFSAIIGLCMCNGAIAPGMMADSIEYGDWKYGVREVGLTFSFVGFSVKLATAVSGVVTVQLLNAIGYVPNVEQTASVKMGINAIVKLFPAAVILVSAIFIFFYDLSPKKMDQIYADLEARRGAEAEKAARAEEQTDAAIEADNEQL